MVQSVTVLVFGLAYLAGLFAVANWGDRQENKRPPGTPRPYIYALSLAVYCTSWTYFGSVGIASTAGLDFLPIYIGPVLFFVFGWRVLQMIADLAKRHNATSIADFLAARYGKSEALGVALLESIDSDDPTALIGLPLIRTCALLREAGLDPLDTA